MWWQRGKWGGIGWTGNSNGNENDKGNDESDGDEGDDYLEDDNNDDDDDDDLVESKYEKSAPLKNIDRHQKLGPQTQIINY